MYQGHPVEQLPIVAPFFATGLASGERCIYVADDYTIDELADQLQVFGIDVAAHREQGALLLWTRDQWRQPGELSSEHKAEQVEKIIEEALAAGYTGIRFAVEMTWTLGPDISTDRLRHWEATINRVFCPGIPARIICQYSQRRMPPDVIEAALQTHPQAIIGAELCDNPFYEAPSILEGEVGENRAQFMLSSLRDLKALQTHREELARQRAALEIAERGRRAAEEFAIRMDNLSAQLRSSQEDLQDLFDGAAIGIHLVAADGTILKANRAELEMLGYEESEYVGLDIRRFHADADVIDDILRRLAAGEVLHDVEATLICKDGSLREVLIDSSVKWAGSEFLHTRCFTRDATDRKLADRAVRHLATIVEASDDAILSQDIDGTISSWNEGAEKLFGYMRAEMIGASMRLVIPGERQGEEDMVLGQIRAGKRVEHYETVRRRKDGELIDVSLSVSPLRDRLGRVVGASKIVRDISEKKRAERSLRESIAAKEQFLSLVSHELRTPTSIIVGVGRLLARRLDELSSDDRAIAFADLVEQGERLQEIIEHLLILTRMDSEHDLYPEFILPERLVNEVLKGWRRRVPDRTLLLTVEAGLPIVSGEPSLTRLVLDNLISNALKYSTADAAVEIAIRAQGDGLVHIEVLDRGIGLGDEDRARIFEPFYRTSAARNKAGGMGLGLAVCRKIVEVQRGTIEALAREGGGSVFRFSLVAPDDMDSSMPV